MTANFTLSITEDEMNAPISAAAIIFPIFAFPAWILCLPPMIWHFQQSNVAAGSLILWMILHNFFNSVNSLIWPRDNVLEWWDGAVWCDVHVHIQIGSYVGLTASMAMVMRKLAIVMDTNNMTLSSSRNSKIKAKIWEVVWCWVIPLFFMALYYVVQPVRYMIYGIVGCMSAHDSSWPSVVLGFMWPTVGMVFASYWSCKSPLLLWLTLTNFLNSSTRLPSLPLPSRVPPPCRGTQHHILTLHSPLHTQPYRCPRLPNLFHLPPRRHLSSHQRPVLLVRNPQSRALVHHLEVPRQRPRQLGKMGSDCHGICHICPSRHWCRCQRSLPKVLGSYWGW